MKLSIDEAVRTAISFDKLVREGMSTNEQIDFLIDNCAQLDEDYNIGGEKRTVLLSDGRYHTFRPLSTLFDSSAFVWDIYRPENLVDLTTQQLATLLEYMTQDPTSLFNIKQSSKRRTFCRALHGHYSARYKCADIVGQKIGASSQTDTSKCFIRHLRMATRFQNTLAVFASEDSTISSVLRMHLNCLKH